MKSKYVFYIILALGLTAFIIYRVSKNKSENESAKPMGGGGITTVEGMVAVPEVFSDNLSLSGTLEANEQVDVRSEITGIVENINFIEGSKVSKGQVLLRINDLELRAQLSKSATAQQLTSENERRARLLLEKQAISQEEYDIASADFKSAQAESQLIAAQVSKATIRAPFSGNIGLRYVSVGTYVTPSTPIATLVNTDQMKITFSVPEKYSSRMKLNSTVTFTPSGSKNERSAKIYAIEPQVDIATRTLKMRAIAENTEGDLFPGTFANVILPLENVEDALLVPTESLIPIQNGKMIFVSRDGKAKQIEVETGSRTDSSIRILSGVKAGDTILTSGVMSLKDGVPVKVKLVENTQMQVD
ncbi:membrane fusion protein, multidrug efflux system [Flavobacteriaceae bacterium MAR_2010_188]|nr:membrane fusion protein, multidrug efflux system [Flavobacteriaceae bacterium MAR_2010_188]